MYDFLSQKNELNLNSVVVGTGCCSLGQAYLEPRDLSTHSLWGRWDYKADSTTAPG